jgi:hypothetical protein
MQSANAKKGGLKARSMKCFRSEIRRTRSAKNLLDYLDRFASCKKGKPLHWEVPRYFVWVSRCPCCQVWQL